MRDLLIATVSINTTPKETRPTIIEVKLILAKMFPEGRGCLTQNLRKANYFSERFFFYTHEYDMDFFFFIFTVELFNFSRARSSHETSQNKNGASLSLPYCLAFRSL